MPIYEYECTACNHHFEEWQKMSDPPVSVCPKCKKKKVQKLISQTSFQLKGGGWYSDLYSSSKPGDKDKKDKKDKGDSGGSKSESNSETKSEAKSETKSETKSGDSSTKKDSGASASNSTSTKKESGKDSGKKAASSSK